MRIAAATISAEAFGTRGQHVAHEVHAAALPARADEHRRDRRLQAEVVVGDHELHAAEAASAEALEERGPEGAVFAVADVDAQHFAVTAGGDAGRDHDRAGHDPAVDAALDVGGVDEHVGELDVVEAAVAERLEVAVELAADAGHLALGDPACRPRAPSTRSSTLRVRHAVHVGLHHHRVEGPVDAPAPLQQLGKKEPWRSFGISSSTSPAGVDNSRGPMPVALASAASRCARARPAPMNAVASASMSCCRTHSRLCGSCRSRRRP